MRTEEFYAFMRKREALRLRKEAGEPWPWTDDKILQEYKFTNVKRAHDRTTRWFWEQLREASFQEASLESQLFNCALFRYFGTIEFFDAIGWNSDWSCEDQRYVKDVAAARLAAGLRVFTGAYVITNQGIKAPKQDVVVDHFLSPFWALAPELVQTATSTKSWEAVYRRMRTLHGFGGTGFMAKEVLQDAMATPVLADCIDRNTWCPVGPGARRGLNRVLERPLKQSWKEAPALAVMLELYEARLLFWPKDYVELELHDIQFQLCEFDKYERVLHGEGRPRSKYRRPV